LHCGRGRFFSSLNDFVSDTRPIVAVIEADANTRRTLCSLLSPLDAEVQDYDSAESYLAARGNALDCLISNVMLPGMSGIELMRVVRATEVPPPVILVGEEADVHAAVTAIREGAADFIEKPHVDISILRRVAYLLDREDAPVH
jgi:FixJ family two-component response regulator